MFELLAVPQRGIPYGPEYLSDINISVTYSMVY